MNMRCWQLGLVAMALVVSYTPIVNAQKKSVAVMEVARGSVPDRDLIKDAPTVITSAKGLEKLWKRWTIADKKPKVDFKKDIVVVYLTVGSGINPAANLDEKGNLDTTSIATADTRPGFRFVICTVGKKGIKTINGKALPTE